MIEHATDHNYVALYSFIQKTNVQDRGIGPSFIIIAGTEYSVRNITLRDHSVHPLLRLTNTGESPHGLIHVFCSVRFMCLFIPTNEHYGKEK